MDEKGLKWLETDENGRKFMKMVVFMADNGKKIVETVEHC